MLCQVGPPPKKRKTKPTPGYHGRNGRRDLAAQYKEKYGGAEGQERLKADMAKVPRHSLKPIGLSTINKCLYCKKLWISFFSAHLDSEEAALKTLEKDAAPPDIMVLKLFIRFVATTGQSKIQGETGWSLQTTQNFLSTIASMRSRHQCEPFPEPMVDDMRNYIEVLAKIEKVIHTKMLPSSNDPSSSPGPNVRVDTRSSSDWSLPEEISSSTTLEGMSSSSKSLHVSPPGGVNVGSASSQTKLHPIRQLMHAFALANPSIPKIDINTLADYLVTEEVSVDLLSYVDRDQVKAALGAAWELGRFLSWKQFIATWRPSNS